MSFFFSITTYALSGNTSSIHTPYIKIGMPVIGNIIFNFLLQEMSIQWQEEHRVYMIGAWKMVNGANKMDNEVKN